MRIPNMLSLWSCSADICLASSHLLHMHSASDEAFALLLCDISFFYCTHLMHMIGVCCHCCGTMDITIRKGLVNAYVLEDRIKNGTCFCSQMMQTVVMFGKSSPKSSIYCLTVADQTSGAVKCIHSIPNANINSVLRKGKMRVVLYFGNRMLGFRTLPCLCSMFHTQQNQQLQSRLAAADMQHQLLVNTIADVHIC